MDPVTRLTLTITHLFDRSGERWRVYVVTFATLAFILAVALLVPQPEAAGTIVVAPFRW